MKILSQINEVFKNGGGKRERRKDTILACLSTRQRQMPNGVPSSPSSRPAHQSKHSSDTGVRHTADRHESGRLTEHSPGAASSKNHGNSSGADWEKAAELVRSS